MPRLDELIELTDEEERNVAPRSLMVLCLRQPIRHRRRRRRDLPLGWPMWGAGDIVAAPRAVVITFALAMMAIIGALAGCGATDAASARPTATATPPPSAGVIYEDSLTDHPAGWPTTGGCAPRADGYHVTLGAVCPAPLAHSLSNGVIRVTAQALATNTNTSYGIVFRLVDLKNYYGFEITPNGKWTFYKEVNGGFHSLVDYTFVGAIQMGSTARNTLEVDANGGHFVFRDGGVLVGQADDATFPSGGCGVDGASGAEVVYTDFRVASA